MKKTTILLSLLLSVLYNGLMAQTMANTLVKNAINHINSHKNATIAFEYEIGNQTLAISEKAIGKAYLQGEAYKLSVEGQEIISDGETLWTYLIDEEEVMVSSPASDESLITPIKMLTTYDQDYTMKYVPCQEKGIKIVEMNNPKGEFSKVILSIDEAKMEIVKATISNRSGDEFSINITQTSYDQDLGDMFFIFDAKAHPNVEVIDMR